MFGFPRSKMHKEVQIVHNPDGSIIVRPSNPQEIADYSKKTRQFETAPSAEGEILLAAEGRAACVPETIGDVFKRVACEKGERMALQWEVTSLPGMPLVGWSWCEYYGHVRRSSKALMGLGLQQHQCVCLIGFNSKEWFCAQIGAILAGGMASGIYSSNCPTVCEYILQHSSAKVVFADSCFHLKKFIGLAIPTVTAFVVWGEEVPQHLKQQLLVPVLSWSEYLAKGEAITDQQLDERMSSVRPGHTAVLVYTSGTTGKPKACMLSHDNLVWSCKSVYQMIKGHDAGQEAIVSYLPLSHVAGLQLDVIVQQVATAHFGPNSNLTITFARPDALKGTLTETLKKARPTIFLGVPRVWEKMMEGIKAAAAKNHMGTLSRAALEWAKFRAWRKYVDGSAGGPGGDGLRYRLALRLVLSRVHQQLGLDRCHDHCYTGAAPLGHHVAEFFACLGVNIKEIFGLSESSAIGCVSTNAWYKLGAVGSIPLGAEVKLLHVPSRDQPNQGELCLRGRHVMLGYLNDENKTRQTIDEEGWLLTGDVATVDDKGMVTITGRIKELLVTAGGENVAPCPIEEFIKERLPCVSNLMLVGDRMKFLSLLVALKTQTDQTGDACSNTLTGPAVGFAGSDAGTVEEARECAKYMTGIEDAIRAYNSTQAVSHAQRVQKFRVIDHDFTVNGGELTATLKVRRSEVVKKYKDVIDDMYTEGGKSGLASAA